MNRLPVEHTYITQTMCAATVIFTDASGKELRGKSDSFTVTERRIEDAHAPSMFDPVVVHCECKPIE